MSGNQTTDAGRHLNAPQMGLSPEKLAGQDSAAAGGDRSRGLAGLDPRQLGGWRDTTVGKLVETEIDGTEVLVGVYGSEREAQRAVDELESIGFDRESIRLLSKSIEETKQLTDQLAEQHSTVAAEPEAERMEGQVGVGQVSKINLGTGVGLLTGAAAGAVLGLAAMVMPGLGGLIGDNAVTAMIAGALVLAGVGAWAGSLAGYGFPDEEALDYTDELRNGAWLVAVRTNQIDQAFAVLRDAGARNLEEFEPAGSH